MTAPDPAAAEDLDPAAAARWLASDDPPLLIDCREPSEHALCRIAGNSLVPLRDFPEQARRRIDPPDRPVLVYCHHGVRSLRAARWLRASGFPNAFSLRGGIHAWSLEVDPSVPRY